MINSFQNPPFMLTPLPYLRAPRMPPNLFRGGLTQKQVNKIYTIKSLSNTCLQILITVTLKSFRKFGRVPDLLNRHSER